MANSSVRAWTTVPSVALSVIPVQACADCAAIPARSAPAIAEETNFRAV
jgi:hypothetical protein